MAMILLPSVVRQYRRPDMAPSFAPGAYLVARSNLSGSPPSARSKYGHRAGESGEAGDGDQPA